MANKSIRIYFIISLILYLISLSIGFITEIQSIENALEEMGIENIFGWIFVFVMPIFAFLTILFLLLMGKSRGLGLFLKWLIGNIVVLIFGIGVIILALLVSECTNSLCGLVIILPLTQAGVVALLTGITALIIYFTRR